MKATTDQERVLKEISSTLKEIRKELHTIASSMKPVKIDGKKLEESINKRNHEHGFNFR